MANQWDKEQIYDEQIAPLMQQIIEICKKEEIPFVAQFGIHEQHPEYDEGDPMYCTSVIIEEKKKLPETIYDHLSFVAESMRYGRNGKPFVAAMTIRRSE